MKTRTHKLRQYGILSITVFSLIGIVVWQLVFSSVNFYIISAAMLVLSMLPFFIKFEKKKTSAREVTLVATMIALAVASRAAFYLIPEVKPIAAVVIVGAVCLGAERGYIIGAFSMFVSNFLFGQGYWTPFQMAAMGIVGFMAGLFFHKHQGSKEVNRKSLLKQKLCLSLAGFVLAFAVYGLVVDISTILVMYGNQLTWQGVLSVYAAGVPFSLAFGISTAVFLFLFGETFIRKVNRITAKFDMGI